MHEVVDWYSTIGGNVLRGTFSNQAQSSAVSIENHDIFVEYSPHIGAITIRFFNGKWHTDDNDDPCESFTIYIADALFGDDCIDQLEEVKIKLEQLTN